MNNIREQIKLEEERDELEKERAELEKIIKSKARLKTYIKTPYPADYHVCGGAMAWRSNN